MAVPISIADKASVDCGLVFANKAFADLTGYSSEEVVGKNCRFLQGPSTDPAAVEKIRVAVAENRRLYVCILNYRKDGSPFHNLLMLTPIGLEGKARYVLGCQFRFDAAQNNAAIGKQIEDFNGILSHFPFSDSLAQWQHHRDSNETVRMIVDSYLIVQKNRARSTG